MTDFAGRDARAARAPWARQVARLAAQANFAGLIHLTRRMSLRLIQDHIAVTAIAPGAFASDMNRAARDQGDEVARRIPAQRIGSTEDMAGAAIFLASRAGDCVVGATLVVVVVIDGVSLCTVSRPS